MRPIMRLCILLFMCGILPVNNAFGGGEISLSNGPSLQETYQTQHLSIFGPARFQVIQNGASLTAYQFATLTQQHTLAKEIAQHRRLRVVGGIVAGTMGVGVGLIGAALSILSMNFGEIGFFAVGAGLLISGGAIIYGAVKLVEVRIPVHRIWSRKEAGQHVVAHNRRLLFSRRVPRTSPLRLNLGFAFHRNQFMISTRF